MVRRGREARFERERLFGSIDGAAAHSELVRTGSRGIRARSESVRTGSGEVAARSESSEGAELGTMLAGSDDGSAAGLGDVGRGTLVWMS